MKKRLSLFSFTFLIFYALLIIGRQLPQLLHGRFSFGEGSHGLAEWLQFAGDILIYYLLDWVHTCYCAGTIRENNTSSLA